MDRKPIDDFFLVKDRLIEISKISNIEDVFKDLSESLAIVENDILTDNISDNFTEDLGNLIINYLSLLSLKYDINDLYSFLESRSNWGVYDTNHFLNTKEALVKPYYSARMSISSLILNNNGISLKPLFDLSAYLIYLEERN